MTDFWKRFLENLAFILIVMAITRILSGCVGVRSYKKDLATHLRIVDSQIAINNALRKRIEVLEGSHENHRPHPIAGEK